MKGAAIKLEIHVRNKKTLQKRNCWDRNLVQARFLPKLISLKSILKFPCRLASENRNKRNQNLWDIKGFALKSWTKRINAKWKLFQRKFLLEIKGNFNEPCLPAKFPWNIWEINSFTLNIKHREEMLNLSFFRGSFYSKLKVTLMSHVCLQYFSKNITSLLNLCEKFLLRDFTL